MILIASNSKVVSVIGTVATGAMLLIDILVFAFDVKKINAKLKELEKPKIEFVKYFIPMIVCFLVVVVQVNVIINTSKLTVRNNKVETGALINMNLDTFTRRFDKAHSKSMEELVGQSEEFGLSKYWSNLVPPLEDYTDTGAEFVMYSAFVENEYLITASFVDNKIMSVDVSYEHGENFDLICVMYMDAMMAVSDMDVYEASEIVDIINDGIMEGTMVYKDGILYGMKFESRAYSITPATEAFVHSIEAERSIVYK